MLILFIKQWVLAWVIFAVVLYVAADSIQRYLYENPVEKLAWRIMSITPLLAAMLVKWPLPFDLVFYSLSTPIQIGVWFFACWFGLRFAWPHALALAAIAVPLIGSITSYTVDSLIRG